MSRPERQILLINLIRHGEVTEEIIELDGITFRVRCHAIGWNFELAEQLISLNDGIVDAIALSGIQRHLEAGSFRTSHFGYLHLLRAATRTPIYVADDIREFFTEWTIARLLKDEPGLFRGRKVLFHSALASPALKPIAAAGARIFSADPLIIAQLNMRLDGIRQIELFARATVKARKLLTFHRVKPLSSPKQHAHNAALKKWVADCDIFVGFGNMIGGIADLSILRGKLVIIDHLDLDTKEKLQAAGATDVIELVPSLEYREKFKTRYIGVLAAMLDLKRQAEDSPLDFQSYVLEWYQQGAVKPKKRSATQRTLPRKCAFIIHPLNQDMLWMAPGAASVGKAPAAVKGRIEKVVSHLPIFHYGSLKGIVSEATGQEVVCDFYAMPATPKQIMAMDEEALYRRLLQGVELAHKNGASIVGLGAYTKVAGDAGLTVSRRAPLPVTNGNSYSASTSLWAAREMIEKLGLVSGERVGQRFKAKATIVGATGSIGRVSSLLVSLVVQELVLVANRADRLLELRDDILAISPDCNVRIATRAEQELPSSDLVVSATSNHRGSTFDIRYVKPGAVVVDCSRPVDVGPELARKRPDVLVVESGEVLMPGDLRLTGDIGLPKPAVYACTAETILLALEGRLETFSVGKQLSMAKVKEIYKMGEKHGVKLAAIRGPLGFITDETIRKTREAALEKLNAWKIEKRTRTGRDKNNPTLA